MAPTNSSRDDRRRSARYPHLLRASYRLLGREDAEPRSVSIEDISRCGMALVLDIEVGRGGVLVVTFANVSRPLDRPILVRVAHVRTRGNTWHVGCSFVKPLTEEILQALLLVP